MPESCVLDASALLAALFDEPGSGEVSRVLNDCVLSAVNYSEVIARLVREGEPRESAVRLIDDLDLPIIPWDHELARAAADLSALSWTHGLSFGDRACLATARKLKRLAVTADRSWKNLPKLDIAVRLIR